MKPEEDIIQKAIDYTKSRLREFDAGHDWSHAERVLKLAVHLREEEGAGDIEIIELAAILHDIADTKFHDGSEDDSGILAYEFLKAAGYDQIKAAHVKEIIDNLSFRKSLEGISQRTIEFQIVQDADRLDAMGAIGIARAFNYGGYKNRPLYDPDIPSVTFSNMDEYKKSTSPTINHFHEKLFLLKDKMNTATGKALAEERDAFMKEYLERFLNEWNGNC